MKHPILQAVIVAIICTVVIRILDRHKTIDKVADHFDPSIIFS